MGREITVRVGEGGEGGEGAGVVGAVGAVCSVWVGGGVGEWGVGMHWQPLNTL